MGLFEGAESDAERERGDDPFAENHGLGKWCAGWLLGAESARANTSRHITSSFSLFLPCSSCHLVAWMPERAFVGERDGNYWGGFFLLLLVVE